MLDRPVCQCESLFETKDKMHIKDDLAGLEVFSTVFAPRIDEIDVLDNVLESLKLSSSVFTRMELTGEWGFAKSPLHGASFHAVLRGEAWLRLPGDREARHLGAGEVVILPGGEAHDLLSSPNSNLVRFTAILARLGLKHWTPGSRFSPFILHLGSRGTNETHILSGIFGFDGRSGAAPLLAALPRFLHLRSPTAHDWLASTLVAMDRETARPSAGSGAAAEALADLLFIQALREYFADEGAIKKGWLKALVNPRLSKAVSAMHRQPSHGWSIAALASEAGMSRSRFAEHFQQIVGRSPIGYLTDLRMSRAAKIIAREPISLADVANQAGYASDVSFGKAFKRWSGLTPAEYRRAAGNIASS